MVKIAASRSQHGEDEFIAGLDDPKLKARLADLGGEPLKMTPGEFGKFVTAETEKMGKVIKAAGISVK